MCFDLEGFIIIIIIIILFLKIKNLTRITFSSCKFPVKSHRSVSPWTVRPKYSLWVNGQSLQEASIQGENGGGAGK
jgi:hypothetical protein